MLIDKHIGFDETDGEGIIGSEFSRELLFLDTLNKSRIQIWINSPGGLVTDGEQIYYTILKTKTKVDTYNMGVCASIAAPIFSAGRLRVMSNHSQLMVHDPFIPNKESSDNEKKGLEAFRMSIVKMLSVRSGLSEDEIGKLMSEETWFDSEQALKLGLCDEVENLGEYNKPRKKPENIKASWKQYAYTLNKLIEEQKIHKMKNVTAKLKLNEAASETAIVEAIDSLITTATNKSKEADDIKKEMCDLKDKYDALEKQYNSMKEDTDKKAKDASDAAAKAETEGKAAKAKDLVAGYVKAYKVQNKKEVIEGYEKLAIVDFESTKAALEALPVNRTGANFTDEEVEKNTPKEVIELRPNIDRNNPQAYVAAMNAAKLREINAKHK